MGGRETGTKVDVRIFGARGDGINNDSPHIQRGLDALATSMADLGGSLFFPPGTYLITTPLAFPSGVTIEGTGDDAVLVVGVETPTVPFTAFTVPVGGVAEFINVAFRNPLVPPVPLVLAIDHLGGGGTLSLVGVTEVNDALIRVGTGARLLQSAATEISEDIQTLAAPITFTHFGDALWIGSPQPRIIKGPVDPTLGAGVAAPLGSIFLSETGDLFVKTGAADTAWTSTSSGAGGVGIEDEGVAVGTRPTVNFTGSGVTAVDDPPFNRVNVDIPGNALAIEDEGVLVGNRPTLNFIGAGVTATDDVPNDRINVTIPGDAGGSSILTWGNPTVGSAADTRFLSPGSSFSLAPIVDIQAFRMPRAGTIQSLRVRHNSAGGNGNSVVYTLLVNGAPSTLTATLATGAAGDASDLVNTVVVAAGDLITMEATKALLVGGGDQDVMVSVEVM